MGDCITASTAMINQARVTSNDPHFGIVKETVGFETRFGVNRLLFSAGVRGAALLEI